MRKLSRIVVALNYVPKRIGKYPLDWVTGNNLYTTICGDPDYEDSVYMSPESYAEIIGKCRAKAGRFKRRLTVIRIFSPKTHRSIYRKFVTNPMFRGLNKTNLALHPSSIRELGDNKEIVNSSVIVSQGSFFLFFWRHPFHATRISMKLGVFSILLAIISIILTIVLH